jgi:hypothetical protein
MYQPNPTLNIDLGTPGSGPRQAPKPSSSAWRVNHFPEPKSHLPDHRRARHYAPRLLIASAWSETAPRRAAAPTSPWLGFLAFLRVQRRMMTGNRRSHLDPTAHDGQYQFGVCGRWPVGPACRPVRASLPRAAGGIWAGPVSLGSVHFVSIPISFFRKNLLTFEFKSETCKFNKNYLGILFTWFKIMWVTCSNTYPMVLTPLHLGQCRNTYILN